MEEVKTATESTETIATQTAVVTVEDLEAKNAALEQEKAKLIEESANYKVAYLKEKKKHSEPEDEDEDDKIRRIAQETLANSRIAEIAREQDAIIKKALKENKEMKLALNNKTPSVSAAVGTHSEAPPVRDTLVTPEQLEAFKKMGWSDKDIERYKKNLQRYAK
jgi:hypothetical protein